MIKKLVHLYRAKFTKLRLTQDGEMIVTCGGFYERLTYLPKSGWHSMQMPNSIGYTRRDIRKWALTRDYHV